MPHERPTRKTTKPPYTSRRASRPSADISQAQAPGSPRNPGSVLPPEQPTSPGQGELPTYAVLEASELDLQVLQASFQDLDSAANQNQQIHSASQEGQLSVTESEEDVFHNTQDNPNSDQQAGYQVSKMAATYKTKVDILINDIEVQTRSLRPSWRRTNLPLLPRGEQALTLTKCDA